MIRSGVDPFFGIAASFRKPTLSEKPDPDQGRRPSWVLAGPPHAVVLRVEGVGTVRAARHSQRITVAAFTRPGRVTYAAVVFRNPRATPRFDERIVDRMLRTLRG